jgi:hypothetical protein
MFETFHSRLVCLSLLAHVVMALVSAQPQALFPNALLCVLLQGSVHV